ncbi:MAG: hypothetical protein QXR31_04440 [Zestosphaera sp.]
MHELVHESYVFKKYMRAHMSELKTYVHKKDELKYVIYARALRYAYAERNPRIRSVIKAYAKQLRPKAIESKIEGMGYHD